MSKNIDKHLVGQPIFKQIMKIIPRGIFDDCVRQLQADRYYKAFLSWDQLILMLFGIFSRCDSMSEVCDGLRAMDGKLNYLGMDISPAKSTAGDGLRNRDASLFQLFFFRLQDYFSSIISVSRKKNHRPGISFDSFFSIDSTTISLFSDIMKGVGRNPKGDGKRKGGLKVHMLTDIHADTPIFATITESRVNDRKFLRFLSFPKGSMIVFDKAYNSYQQFAEWTSDGVSFVGRLREKSLYEILDKPLYEKELSEKEFGVFKEEQIHVNYHEYTNSSVNGEETIIKSKEPKKACFRLVHYKDEKNRLYEFITNNWDISNEEVALIYKCRWSIETTFKKLKQNFQLTYFYSDSVNGIETQVWCTLIAYLLLRIIQIHSNSKKAFSTIAALIRMFLAEYKDLFWLVTESRKAYCKNIKGKNKSPTGIQLSIFASL